MHQITFDNLARSKYVSLTTYRKNGQPVSTPIWIAQGTDSSGVLYAFSDAGAGKIKRIRGNSAVRLAPCDFRGRVKGGSVEAAARILPADLHEAADAALRRKHPIAKRLLRLLGRIRGNSGAGSAYIEIVAAEHVASATGA